MNECSIKKLREKTGRGLITSTNITEVRKKQKVSLNMESIYVTVWELRDNPSDNAICALLSTPPLVYLQNLRRPSALN